MKTAAQVLEAFDNIRRAQRAGVYAPHKPLLILLALARVQRNEPRLVEFTTIDTSLQALLTEFGPSGAAKSRHYPLWHLLHHQGVIALYATTIDSSVEGNLMEETGGLGGDPTYVEYPDDGGTIVSTQLPHLFVAIRHNQFLGEPAYGDPVSEGGVSVLAASYGAHGAPSTEVAAFGLDIAHNRFVDVDANALYGGAINVFVVDASTAGSASLRDTLIHHNDVAFSGRSAGRIGTRIWDANHTLASLVLDDNPVAGGCECEDPWAASTPLPPASCVPTCP